MKVLTSRRGVTSTKGCPSSRVLTRAVKTVLSQEKARWRGELSIIFVDPKTIRRLHRDYLGDSTSTDVMAFPYDKIPEKNGEAPLGDVYICLSQALQNAKRYGEPLAREVIRLVVHGVLHLLGYSDQSPRERTKMWSQQEKIVEMIIPKVG